MNTVHRYRAGLAALTVGSALILTGCGSADAASPTGSDEPAVIVTVKDMAYSEQEITIQVGDTVQWVFADGGMPHDVSGEGALEGKLQSDLLTSGTYEYTFTEAGTFDYHCTPHPMMTGTVVVEG